MKPLIAKVRPANGFARVVHILLLSLLPIIMFVLVRIDLVWLAGLTVVLSKWRMFAVKPRFWPANIRANSVDIMVGLAILIFMIQSDSQAWQLVWVVLYAGWLTIIKPAANAPMVAVQALIGYISGLSALFLVGDDLRAIYLVLGVGLICYLSAHHFLDAFEEGYARLLSYMWGWFGAGLAWVLSHWLLYYPSNGFIAQPVMILVAIGYGLAGIYYLDHTERLSSAVRNQFVFLMCTITIIILIFSDWTAKIV